MLVYHLAFLVKEQQGGNVADAVFNTQFITLVNVILADDSTISIGFGQILDDRSDAAAGTAPGSPEVNHNGFPRFQKTLVVSVINYCSHCFFLLCSLAVARRLVNDDYFITEYSFCKYSAKWQYCQTGALTLNLRSASLMLSIKCLSTAIGFLERNMT